MNACLVAQRLSTSPMICRRFWPVGSVSGNDRLPGTYGGFRQKSTAETMEP
jgi:hypothetical protein